MKRGEVEITIQEIGPHTLQDVNQCDGTFAIDSKMVLHAEKNVITYTMDSVAQYNKRYPIEEMDASTYVSNPNRTIFFAYIDGELAGQIRVIKYWNAYAYIADIVVDVRYRKQGVGKALIERAIAWAKSGGFPGMMLETQNNNVAACRLYESCGFVLGGFDGYLYKGLNRTMDEIALYWYLIFD